MLKSITISNFRGIKKGSIDNLSQITILIGKNCVGKSSILEALYLVSACASKHDPLRNMDKLDYVIYRRGGRGEWNRNRYVLWYQQNVKEPIKINLKIKDKLYEFLIIDEVKHNYPVRLKLNDDFIDLETQSRIYRHERIYVSDRVEALKAVLESKEEKRSESSGLDEVREFLKGVVFIDNRLLMNYVDLTEKSAWRLVTARRLDKVIVELLREEFEPDSEGLTYIPYDQHYALSLQTSRTTFRIDELGDGARYAVLSSLIILAYRPSLLLIEEPELHMHPRGLYVLLKFILKLSKEKRFQVIMTTHSIEAALIIGRVCKELGMDASFKFIEKEEGILKVRDFTIEEAEILRRLDIDLRLLDVF